MADNTSTNFPNSNSAFCMGPMPAEGEAIRLVLTKEARYLLQNLWNRTGGGTGGDVTAIAALAAAALANAQASLKIAANLGDLNNVVTARNNLNLGPTDDPTFDHLTVSDVTISGKIVVSAQQAGWTNSTTTPNQGPLADYTGGTTPANLDSQVQLVTKVLGTLINSLRSFGTLGT